LPRRGGGHHHHCRRHCYLCCYCRPQIDVEMMVTTHCQIYFWATKERRRSSQSRRRRHQIFFLSETPSCRSSFYCSHHRSHHHRHHWRYSLFGQQKRWVDIHRSDIPPLLDVHRKIPMAVADDLVGNGAFILLIFVFFLQTERVIYVEASLLRVHIK